MTSEQFKKDMEALAAGVLEKHDAIATKVRELTDAALKAATERTDDIEKRLNRGTGQLQTYFGDAFCRPYSGGVAENVRSTPDCCKSRLQWENQLSNGR
jgi:hypothetical protein